MALLDETQRALCRKRIWTPADFAAWLGGGTSRKKALRILKGIDAEAGGALLTKSGEEKPEYCFSAARLSRLRPEYFLPVSVEATAAAIARLEEELGEVAAEQRRLAMQTGENTRGIREMKAARRSR